MNKKAFKTKLAKAQVADTRNEAGGLAYKAGPKAALAQFACTGCFNDQYYSEGTDQVAAVLELCQQVEPSFVARVAVYARKTGYMKDMPAFLVAWLSVNAPEQCDRIFHTVIDNGKMLRNFVQIIRSGVLGARSITGRKRRLVREWFDRHHDDVVFKASIGTTPSIADVIKLSHPKPKTPERNALYGYLLGKEHSFEKLPALVRQYEDFKVYMHLVNDHNRKPAEIMPVPNVPFQMLDSLGLGTAEWTEIARTHDRFLFTLMNLNTFRRHDVFKNPELVSIVAKRLSDPEIIKKAMVFPYRMLAAYRAVRQPSARRYGYSVQVPVDHEMPRLIIDALHVALEHSLMNVPEISGNVVIAVDVSGSMRSPATGHRKGSTTNVRAVDVAALIASAIYRQNPDAKIYPFDGSLHRHDLEPRDTVITNADRLAAYGGGTTNWELPLVEINRTKNYPDLCIYASDMQGWVGRSVDSYYGGRRGQATGAAAEWAKIKKAKPSAKIVMINLQAYDSLQIPEGGDEMLVGGFSDTVFKLVAMFAAGELTPENWVAEIEKVEV